MGVLTSKIIFPYTSMHLLATLNETCDRDRPTDQDLREEEGFRVGTKRTVALGAAFAALGILWIGFSGRRYSRLLQIGTPSSLESSQGALPSA